MERIFRTLRASRHSLLRRLGDVSEEDFNFIPPGFNNNLVWQLGHIVVSQQLLCYQLSGNPLGIPENWRNEFRNGTKPEKRYQNSEIDALKNALLQTLDTLEEDLKLNRFSHFHPYTVSTYAGLELKDIEDALTFIVSHDALHYGCCLSLKKFLPKS